METNFWFEDIKTALNTTNMTKIIPHNKNIVSINNCVFRASLYFGTLSLIFNYSNVLAMCVFVVLLTIIVPLIYITFVNKRAKTETFCGCKDGSKEQFDTNYPINYVSEINNQTPFINKNAIGSASLSALNINPCNNMNKFCNITGKYQ